MVDLAEEIRRRGRPERLDVVGVCNRDRQRAAADARIRAHQLEDVVTRVGWDTYVPPSQMPPYYRRADVGLFLAAPAPNLTRSMPTKFYEYLHYGLPIISSDVPLWRSFVEANECGAVVPPGDADAVLDVLDRWRERPALYRRYAENARAAAAEYRWEQMGERLVHVYRCLLGRSENSRAG
jgi:glycosyltransferase involved in cell wall biosynthesis